MGCTWRRFRLEPGTVSTKWICVAIINNHLKPRKLNDPFLINLNLPRSQWRFGSILPRFCWLVSLRLQNSAFTPVPMTYSTMCRVAPRKHLFYPWSRESLPLKSAFSISLSVVYRLLSTYVFWGQRLACVCSLFHSGLILGSTSCSPQAGEIFVRDKFVWCGFWNLTEMRFSSLRLSTSWRWETRGCQ